MSEFVAFYVCAKCGFEWETSASFVQDQSVRVVAYQPVFSWPEEGIVFFRHDEMKCSHSFTLRLYKFDDMMRHSGTTDLKFMDPACQGQCFIRQDLGPCNVECSLRWTRDLLQCLMDHRLP